jgi:hypothetical protein
MENNSSSPLDASIVHRAGPAWRLDLLIQAQGATKIRGLPETGAGGNRFIRGRHHQRTGSGAAFPGPGGQVRKGKIIRARVQALHEDGQCAVTTKAQSPQLIGLHITHVIEKPARLATAAHLLCMLEQVPFQTTAAQQSLELAARSDQHLLTGLAVRVALGLDNRDPHQGLAVFAPFLE